MSRKLDDLEPNFKLTVFELLARLTEAGIMVQIIDTLRTPAEQEENIRKGVSWTKHSKHLPNPAGKARAIDICPYGMWNLHGPDKLQWDAADPIWNEIGKVGEGLGLAWGGRWKQKDMGHFEVK